MSITSVRFLLFAGATMAVYYRVPKRWQWKVLLAASLLFAAVNGCLIFLLFTVVTAYAAGRHPALSRWCVLLNIGMLAFCKIFLKTLPFGISFFTFQAVGYMVQVRRQAVEAEKNPLRLTLFLSFFPQLVQGPISRKDQLEALFVPHDPDRRQITAGLRRMLWGYFKKLVIADRIAPVVQALRQSTGWGFLLLTVCYAVQIYGDFTGGIDIVLGLGQCFGVSLPENFNHPFASKSVAEYWRRWHITLGAWMKDFVFYPVSVSAPMRRFSRFTRRKFGTVGKRLPVWIATMVTWLATGIWHGTTPNFLLWGMLNCGVILISQELAPVYAAFHRRFGWKEKRWYGCFETVRTFLLMNLIRACDLFPNVKDYVNRVGTLFSPCVLPESLGITPADWVVLALGIGLTVLAAGQPERLRQGLEGHPKLRFALLAALFLAVLVLGKYGVGYNAGTFIYHQF